MSHRLVYMNNFSVVWVFCLYLWSVWTYILLSALDFLWLPGTSVEKRVSELTGYCWLLSLTSNECLPQPCHTATTALTEQLHCLSISSQYSTGTSLQLSNCALLKVWLTTAPFTENVFICIHTLKWAGCRYKQFMIMKSSAGMSLVIVPWLETSDGQAHLESLAISLHVITAGRPSMQINHLLELCGHFLGTYSAIWQMVNLLIHSLLDDSLVFLFMGLQHCKHKYRRREGITQFASFLHLAKSCSQKAQCPQQIWLACLRGLGNNYVSFWEALSPSIWHTAHQGTLFGSK